MPIGDRQASCASWQQALDLSIWCHVFPLLNLLSFHLISSHRSFSWKLLTHCHRSLRHPISSQLISTHLMSPEFFHLMQRLLEIAHCIPLSPQSVSSQLISSHFITDFLQILKVQVVKMKPGLSVPRGRSENDPGSNECVPKPSAGQASPSIFRDTFCPAKHSISRIRYLSNMNSCETSLKKWKLTMWKRSFHARHPSKSQSRRWVLFAVSSLGSEISWLWDLLAVRSLGCEISWLWDRLAEISWLWDLLAERSLGWEISWLWDLLAVANRFLKICSSEVRPSNFLWLKST